MTSERSLTGQENRPQEHGDMDSEVHRPRAENRSLTWASGEKYGFGTACDYGEDPSRVWFSLTEGALTEPRFPRVDFMQFRLVDFLIVDPETGYTARTHDVSWNDPDRRDTTERKTTLLERSLCYRQEISETGEDCPNWTLTVEYTTDPEAETILFDVRFDSPDPLDVYVVGEAAIGGYIEGTVGGIHETPAGHALIAQSDETHEPKIRDEDGQSYDIAAALVAESGFDVAAWGTHDDDAVRELLGTGTVPDREESARDSGAETAHVLAGRLGESVTALDSTVALGFTDDGTPEAAVRTARESLDRGFDGARRAYRESWETYLSDRPIPDVVADDPALETQYWVAVCTLKAVEDKTVPGASVASPCVPWGDGVDAREPRDYGYNFTWSRDQYQVATALRAVGDSEATADALAYLYEYQQDSDGFLPQNTYIDGRTRWGGEQLDNIAYPAVIAYQLAQEDGIALAEAAYDYDDIRRSLEYLLRSGPASEQERWEEEAGYSPSTIAAIVAALGCGATLATAEGTRSEALAYLAHADEWRLAVDDWCATENPTGDRPSPHYIRVSEDGQPDSPSQRTLANNGPTLDERDIIDAGFLELVRLGLRDPDEEVIENSVAVVDETIRIETPNGPCWYRYNDDAYGELGADSGDEGGPWCSEAGGSGRLWPILTGERGEYELRREDGDEPMDLLYAMANFGNDGKMIAEQVWDKPERTAHDWEFGEGTGAATPLAWSMAQYIRLAHSIEAGEPIETPAFLDERYRQRDPQANRPELHVEAVETDGETVHLSGHTSGSELVLWTAEAVEPVELEGGEFTVRTETDGETVALAAGTGEEDLREVATALERIPVASR